MDKQVMVSRLVESRGLPRRGANKLAYYIAFFGMLPMVAAIANAAAARAGVRDQHSDVPLIVAFPSPAGDGVQLSPVPGVPSDMVFSWHIPGNFSATTVRHA